jgi:undecaprenyl-diphosphatase
MDAFLDGPWAYLILLVTAFAENSVGVGLFLPVETLLLAAASFCALGELSAPLVIGSVLVGAVAGDSVGYLIGRRFGPAITRRLDGHLGITDARVDEAHRAFLRWGMWAVAIGRMIPGIRFLVILLAGDSGLPYRKFLIADVAGIVVWVSAHFALGYALGTGVEAVGGTRDLLLVVAATSIGGMIVLLVGRWWMHHRRRAAPAVR